MAKFTNEAAGPRGINLSDGSILWVEPGATVEVDDAKAVAHADITRGDKAKSEPEAKSDKA